MISPALAQDGYFAWLRALNSARQITPTLLSLSFVYGGQKSDVLLPTWRNRSVFQSFIFSFSVFVCNSIVFRCSTTDSTDAKTGRRYISLRYESPDRFWLQVNVTLFADFPTAAEVCCFVVMLSFRVCFACLRVCLCLVHLFISVSCFVVVAVVALLWQRRQRELQAARVAQQSGYYVPFAARRAYRAAPNQGIDLVFLFL